MKLFVISDVHGHYTIMKKALEDAGYDKHNEDHLLISCGDTFDRGDESFEVLQYLDMIDRKVLIRGNHDDNLESVLYYGRLEEVDFHNGVDKTIESFFGKYSIYGYENAIDMDGKTSMIKRITDFQRGMKNYYETKNYIFVHGWLPDRSGVIPENWREATDGQWRAARWTYWKSGCKMEGMPRDKTIVCGHYPTIFAGIGSSDIYYGEGFITIDAGTATTGKVNVLVLEDDLL